MSRHQSDLVMCLKQPGTAIGKLCERCNGRCPICDSYVRATEKVRICDECSFGTGATKCIICGMNGSADAYYCYECVMCEKNRDGCPRITNVGSTRSDLYYDKKRIT